MRVSRPVRLIVAAKNMVNNHLIVVQDHNHPALLTHHLNALDLHWISGHAPEMARSYNAKTRYRQTDAACRISSMSNSNGSIEFSAAQWAVTPGQSVVVYDGEVCLGGGIISTQ